jgi:AcrR family transcriptional regulator
VALFAERGFDSVGLRELAAHLGIKAGSLYNHIESKEALLFELIESLYEDLLDVVTRPERRPVSQQVRLDRLIDGHVQLYREKADYFRVAQHAKTCLSARHQETIAQLRNDYERHLMTVLNGLGLPPRSLALVTTRSVAALLHHLPHWLGDVDIASEGYRQLLGRMILGAVTASDGASD